MLYESTVRAATARYFLDHNQPKIAALSLRDDQPKAFWWTEKFANLFSTAGVKR